MTADSILDFSLSILAPIASVVSIRQSYIPPCLNHLFVFQMRAAFVSVNLFSLLCNGTTPATTASLGDIMRFGGPVVYLICYTPILFGFLLLIDSGFIKSLRLLKNSRCQARSDPASQPLNADVAAEASAVSRSTDDALRVLGVNRSFNGKKAVDDVSFGVSKDTVFALLGPNGAGKTTTLNMIRMYHHICLVVFTVLTGFVRW